MLLTAVEVFKISKTYPVLFCFFFYAEGKLQKKTSSCFTEFVLNEPQASCPPQHTHTYTPPPARHSFAGGGTHFFQLYFLFVFPLLCQSCLPKVTHCTDLRLYQFVNFSGILYLQLVGLKQWRLFFLKHPMFRFLLI